MQRGLDLLLSTSRHSAFADRSHLALYMAFASLSLRSCKNELSCTLREECTMINQLGAPWYATVVSNILGT